jgi:hypothetical protein
LKKKIQDSGLMRITVLCFCSIIWTSNLLIVENLKGYEEICSAPVNQAAAERVI